MKKHSPTFVLVRPRNPLNIGASARAMANFGFKKLVVVNPYKPVWKETTSAVGAETVIKKAKRVRSIYEAIKDHHLVIGTSAGKGRTLGSRRIGPDEFGSLMTRAKKSVAVVFGSEKSGLTNKELQYCHKVLTIPTHKQQPSLNLSHAVAITAFLAAQGVDPESKKITSHAPVSIQQTEILLTQALRAFQHTGLFKEWDAATQEKRFREAFARWNINNKDVRMLHRLFRGMRRAEYKVQRTKAKEN